VKRRAVRGRSRQVLTTFYSRDNWRGSFRPSNGELREAELRQQRRRIESDLSQSEARYRRIVETTQEGIWTLDAEGHTTYVNRRMGEMLGSSPEKLSGSKLADFVESAGHPPSTPHQPVGLEWRRWNFYAWIGRGSGFSFDHSHPRGLRKPSRHPDDGERRQ